MANVQYDIGPAAFDANLQDMGLASEAASLNSGATVQLIVNGTYTLAGAPAATAGYFAPGCLITNIVDGDVYRNDGSTAAPVWVAL